MPRRASVLSRPFSIFTDSSDNSVTGACLTEGRVCPEVFPNCRLTAIQQRWATVEKEAYAALKALYFWQYSNVIF